jgi:glutamate formiminotransferase/formiminotetrahydrofolate cyclodeaminase
MKLVECVPNFSEGRNQAVIDAIAEAIRSIEGVTLLDVDPGVDTNRTVVTFLGAPEAVVAGAFAGIAKASELIDMSKHSGAHSRIGACDVCPFVPVRGVEMDECVQLARRLSRRVAGELEIPVYLYEEAATRDERRNLATIRKGEYEGLPDKFKDPGWKPDFGEPAFNPKSGATAIGAREFLIAYNFNLNTRDTKIAKSIALAIREAGRKGVSGKFKHVKAVGWYMQDFNCAQVSMNLTNYKETPLARVFDEVCAQAEQHGARCTGSELVGLIPKDCLLEAGRHFIKKIERGGRGAGVPEPELVRVAVQSLGLNELYPFKPEEKIIENRISDPRPLIEMSLLGFVDETSTNSPAPGGGSVAALCGALASALACMVGQLTVNKKGYQSVSADMHKLCEETQEHKDFLVRAVDDDTTAFNQIMAAFRMPKQTGDQKAGRKQAIEAATRQAIDVPLRVLRRVHLAMPLVEKAAKEGNKNSLSDAGVAASCSYAAAEGAWYNVSINLAGIENQDFAEKIGAEAQKLLDEVKQTANDIADFVTRSLKGK